MITMPIFTRLLSPAEYGEWSVFYSWYGIASIFVSLSLSAGVHTQGLVKFERERAAFSASFQGLSTALTVGWTFLYLIFRPLWERYTGLSMVRTLSMLTMIWCGSAFGFWANERRMSYSYRPLIAMSLVVAVVNPLVGIWLVSHTRDKITARIVGTAVLEVVFYSWMAISQVRRGRTFFSKEFWSYALHFNLPLLPHYLSQTVLSSSDRIMIEKMVGYQEAGLYNLAYSISMVMSLLGVAIMQSISPWIYQKIKDRKYEDIPPVAYLTLSLIAAVDLFLILLAPEVVAIFAPAAYRDAVRTIPPVAMSVFFIYCYDLFAKFAFYYERTKTIMLTSVCGAVLNIVLNRIGIRYFGYIAAGYTTLICYIVYAASHYALMDSIYRDQCGGRAHLYDMKKLLSITVPFLLSGSLILALYDAPLIRYLLALAALPLFVRAWKRSGLSRWIVR